MTENEIIEIIKVCLLEDDPSRKTTTQVINIVRRYLIEKGITQDYTEIQIRHIIRNFLRENNIGSKMSKQDIHNIINNLPSSRTYTIDPNKPVPRLVYNSTNIDTVQRGNSKTIHLQYSGNGTITAKSWNDDIATVTVDGTSITLTGVSLGTVTITIMASETEEYNAAYISLELSVVFGVRYGYRVRKDEPDPYNRVEYLYDAVGLTPAAMNFTTQTFFYGDWADKWFVQDNKPCMLKSDGTVDYYLDPNDYTLKEDGTTSDAYNLDYDGNAMAQIPLCWVYRYEDEEYDYEIVSNVQWDENYKAYAHTRADGSIADYFYLGIATSLQSSKLRSIFQITSMDSSGAPDIINSAQLNGEHWYICTWSQFQLLRTLLVLISKSTNSRAAFGAGAKSDNSHIDRFIIPNHGQFFGSLTYGSSGVKVFHICGLWGDKQYMLPGLNVYNHHIYVKMTPENSGYMLNNVYGYTELMSTNSGTYNLESSNADPYYNAYLYIKEVFCNEFGVFPKIIYKDGNDNKNKYYCAQYCGGYNGFVDIEDHPFIVSIGYPGSVYLNGDMQQEMSIYSMLLYLRVDYRMTHYCILSCEQPRQTA